MTREEAIKILKAIRVYACYPKSASEETKEAIDTAIEALSAEARPTGEWTITLTDDGFGGENTHLICSVCGSEPLAWSSRKFFRYCPSCGAKMGGGDSE